MNVPSNEIEICQQEATLLKSLQEIARSCNEAGAILGVRVVYNCSKSDHAHVHNKHWTEALSDESCRESGTITGFGFEQRATVTVLWDCGTVRMYMYNLWSNITVFTLGPAGKLRRIRS